MRLFGSWLSTKLSATDELSQPVVISMPCNPGVAIHWDLYNEIRISCQRVWAQDIDTPRRACAAKGLSDCSWTGLYNYIYSVCKKILKTQKILTFRSPFQHRKASLQFNGLQYNL